MSAKWRALQHRHRYTYSAVIFPQLYVDALDQRPMDETNGNFYCSLKELVSLSSTYAQISHVKKVASEFSNLLVNGQELLVLEAARFYLEILFFENSNPLHRTLVSVLAKNSKFSNTVGDCFRLLFEEYGGMNGKGKRFCLSRVALSMMSSPKLGYLVDVVEKCATLVAMDIVFGLNSVVSETNDGSRPSPVVLEQCQEALSCVYYLLQRFPSRFSCLNQDNNGLIPEGFSILDMVMTTTLSILKSMAFSRDCFVASGVSFCAALQLFLSPEDLSLAIMEDIFYQKKLNVIGCSEKKRKGNLYSEIKDISPSVRLWLLRGILTAISRTVLNAHFVVLKDDNALGTELLKGNSIWTIMYDGILPELCNYCENRTDSHSNFHALTVMQICLQQIKTSILTDVGKPTENYGLISEDMEARILSIIWNNLEDPLNQTVKQVHMVFDLLLEIQLALHSSEGGDKVKEGLRSTASKLLHLGPHCKGRYIPLSLLTKRLGAKDLLDMHPKLLFESTDVFMEDDACCVATTFLKFFLECLRDECWSEHGIENGYAEYRNHCLPPLLIALSSDCSKLRSNLDTYALPVFLGLDVDAIFSMLAFLSIKIHGEDSELTYPVINHMNLHLREEQQVAVSVSLLKVCRLLALIEGDIDWDGNCSTSEFASFYIKGVKIRIPVKWLIMALTHVDESLRITAAESLLLNPKMASLPSSLELTLMKEAVPLNMRCGSTSFQMKWTSLFRKFCSRVNTALERQLKQGRWKPLSCFNNGDETVNRAEDLFSFMKWLSSFLFFSCYPSAPYERKIMAMELILVMFNLWPISPSLEGKCDSIYPYSSDLTSPDSTLLLVGSIVDSWDRLRENSFHILLHFPTPLPGISSLNAVKELIMWAKQLICSPRVRECDAGAITLRLIFRKYVIELGWIVRPACNETDINNHGKSPVVEYISSLIDWLHMTVEKAENDLTEACKNSFVHGILLTLRYTFEELEWGSSTILCNISSMKIVLEKLLELITRITSMALWVVSAGAWHLSGDMDDLGEDDAFLPTIPDEMGISLSSVEGVIENPNSEQDTRPMEQIIMVGCWLAMKEISLLLGTIIRKIPLPTSNGLNIQGPVPVDDSDSTESSDSVLNLKQLETIGNHFLEVLLKMKHNGAIDKTRAGFTALCNRLLCSNDPRLCNLTESWMDQLMERTIAKGQTVDDLLRRSAGIPASFIALFLSEPEGTPKRLLPKALRWLLDIAERSYTDLSNISNEINVSTQSSDIIVNGIHSKIRDEGVVPTVHAFNILKAAFNDTNLAADTSGFSAEAMTISIRSFSSPYWEVRNSACLAYTALVRRMIGFLNVQKRESARRSLTGHEFFHRYPLLHTFFLDELKVATDLLHDKASRHQDLNLANHVHPSLCPMLILLSRLKPSSETTETEDTLDPFLFMPFIKKCSIQNNHKVRILASRALVGLVSNEKLPSVILNIAKELPNETNETLPSFNSIHGTLLQLISLLDVNCRRINDFERKYQIMVDLFNIIGSKSWLGSWKSCPCPTLNSSFLNMLDQMLNITRNYSKDETILPLRNLLRDLSSECFDLQRPSYDPTVIEWQKQAAKSYLNCFSQEDSFSTFQQRLLSLMTNTIYEVRIVTLKWLLLKDQNEFSNWTGMNLQEILILHLSTEKNRKCVYYILKIIFTWNQNPKQKHEFQHVRNMDYDSLTIFWDILVSLYKSTRYAKTRETLICCMGICAERFSSFTRSNQSEYIDFYIGLIKQHSSSSEPVNMRKAVAESLVASSLLNHTTIFDEHYTLKLLDLWFVAIKLLEDEDIDLRRKLAIDIQKSIVSDHSIIVPSQVEKVIEMSFDHLSSKFGNCLPYYNFLCECVIKNASFVIQNEDIVRRVFDKDIDNHHEEKLLICQLCCYHLSMLLNSSILSDFSIPLLYEWRSKFLERVLVFSHEFLDGNGLDGWIGGIGNHKDVFLPLYGNLLGFYAISEMILKCDPGNGEGVLFDDVVRLGEVIDSFLTNPIIRELYLKVAMMYRSFDEGRKSSFDPYFLIYKR